MKLFYRYACLLTVLFSNVHAVPRWQADAVITLSARNMPVGKIFRAIHQQTGLTVMYAAKMIDESETFTVSFRNTPLDDVLRFLLKGRNLEWVYRDEVIVLRPRQVVVPKDSTLQVTGRVVSDEGQPLPGATIRVGNTNKGAAADAAGNFSIPDVEAGSLLLVSFTGFHPQRVLIKDDAELLLVMKKAPAVINPVEVFHTGYQDVPKERATGSFEFVSNQQLNRRMGPDLLSRLEGVTTSLLFDRRDMVPGKTMLSTENIMIRGISTLAPVAGLKSPLIVVDNFPYEGDINNLNPNDIENVSVLRDAAAASIWGAKAANGVIVINMKKGKFNQPVRVSLNVNMNVLKKPDLFKYPVMPSSDFVDLETFLFSQGAFDGYLQHPYYPAVSPAVEILEKRRNGLISAADSAAQLDALRRQDVRNDFNKYIYQTAVAQQYSVNMNGGSDKLKYFLSAGYDVTPTFLKGEEFKRVTFNSDNTYSPLEKLTMRLGFRYTRTDTKNNSLGNYGSSDYYYRGLNRMPSYTRFDIPYAKDYREGYTDTAGAGRLQDWKYNLPDEIANRDVSSAMQEIVVSAGMQYQLAKFLSVQGDYQYQSGNGESVRIDNAQTYYARNLINLFTNLDATDPAVRNPVPYGGIRRASSYDWHAHMARAQLNYNHRLNKLHQLNAIAGAEIRERVAGTDNQVVYGYDADKSLSRLVNFVTQFPQYGNRGTALIPSFSGLDKRTDHFVSLYGNASYTYDDRYTATISGRRDAANLFGVETNNQWKPFWSAGLLWNVANEEFFRAKFISTLRLRANYGYQGNVNNSISPYTITATSPASASRFNLPFSRILTPANPDLSWEKQKQANIGLDLGFFNGRISASIDAYRKKSDNLILQARIDPTTGLQAVQRNVAGLKGKGLDVTLRSINIKGDFEWATEFGLSTVSTKVTSLGSNQSVNRLAGDVVTGVGMLMPIMGENPYMLYSYPFAGLDPENGDPQGLQGGKVSKDYFSLYSQRADTAGLVRNGSAIPLVFGYLNNSFSCKGFELMVTIAYRLKYHFRKTTIGYYELFEYGNTHPDYLKRWKQPGDEAHTTVPSQSYPADQERDMFYAGASPNVLKADNIRLQLIRLGYSLDLAKTTFPVKQIQAYVNLENAGILWRANKEGLDPDVEYGTGLFPLPMRIGMGLKMNF